MNPSLSAIVIYSMQGLLSKPRVFIPIGLQEEANIEVLPSASHKVIMLAFVGSQEQFAQRPTCLHARMLLKPPTRPKLYSGLTPEEEHDSYSDLIPGLPEDLAKICLALVPRSHFPVMGAVSKRWMSFLESKELISVRKEVGKLEEWVYVLTPEAGTKGSHWQILECSGQTQSPLPRMPGLTKAGFGVVVIGGKLFVIAGYAADHGKEYVSDEVYQYDSCLNRYGWLDPPMYQ